MECLDRYLVQHASQYIPIQTLSALASVNRHFHACVWQYIRLREVKRAFTDWQQHARWCECVGQPWSEFPFQYDEELITFAYTYLPHTRRAIDNYMGARGDVAFLNWTFSKFNIPIVDPDTKTTSLQFERASMCLLENGHIDAWRVFTIIPLDSRIFSLCVGKNGSKRVYDWALARESSLQDINVISMFYGACQCGHYDFVQNLKSQHSFPINLDLNYCLTLSIVGGNARVTQWLLDMGAEFSGWTYGDIPRVDGEMEAFFLVHSLYPIEPEMSQSLLCNALYKGRLKTARALYPLCGPLFGLDEMFYDFVVQGFGLRVVYEWFFEMGARKTIGPFATLNRIKVESTEEWLWDEIRNSP